jgi:hypothetical protein
MHSQDKQYLVDILELEEDQKLEISKADAIYLLHALLIHMDFKDDKCLSLIDSFLLLVNAGFGDAECQELFEIFKDADKEGFETLKTQIQLFK